MHLLIQKRMLQSSLSWCVLSAYVLAWSRGVHDVTHEVIAVGSRDVQKAQEFINLNAGGDKKIKAYGSYDEVFADKVKYYNQTLRDWLLHLCLRTSTQYT